MNPTIKIDGVNITLTSEQLQEIDRQRNTITNYTQIKSYKDACKVLNKSPKVESDFEDQHDWFGHQIKTISRGINSLISNESFPDFKNHSQKKWFIRMEYSVSGGWSLGFCDSYDVDAVCSVGLYKTEESAKYMWNNFKDLYIGYAESY